MFRMLGSLAIDGPQDRCRSAGRSAGVWSRTCSCTPVPILLGDATYYRELLAQHIGI
jgi:hypothetical protein